MSGYDAGADGTGEYGAGASAGGVTDRLRAEAAVQASETRYRRLFEASRDGILLLDGDTGRVLEVNPSLAELLGCAADELVGRPVWEVGLLDARVVGPEALARLRAEGFARYEDVPLKTRQGEWRDVEFVGGAYREDGRAVIQCSVRDVTERKRLERALHQEFLRERRIADALQRPLTLEIPEGAFPGLLVATRYLPALDEAAVGGDFFDAFALPGGAAGAYRVGLALGDTAGKGLSAAARAIQVKEVLRAFARESPPSPADVVARLNRFVCDKQHFDGISDEDGQTFTCLILVLLDPATGEGSVVTAGCEPPLLLRADGRAESLTPENANLPLGVLRDERYTATPLHLGPGDTLVLVTDGITEARRERAFLGYDGMASLARRALAAPTLHAMGDAILEGARAFAGGALHDDGTLLLARRPALPPAGRP